MKIAVLGSGMVGRAIALDLVKNYEVTSFDISEQNLKILKDRDIKINTVKVDLSNLDSYEKLLEDFDFVVSAVPGFMGYDVLRKIILSKKDVVDISFFPEDFSELEQISIEKGVTAIVDCGVAPGMSNLILGFYDSKIKIEKFSFYVGGLPKVRKKPFEYKAPFSPIDVIEEYTRPSRFRVNGVDVVKPALSDPELIHFDKIGTLEAFNTDGLRSILKSFPHIPNMIEKTLRYPGHIDIIKSLKEIGFFDREPISVNGNTISPIEVSSSILIKDWKLGEHEEELTIMKVVIEGEYKDEKIYVSYDLYDEYDTETQISSMARTTGYTATSVLNLMINKMISDKGILPPEKIGKDKNNLDFILSYLGERGVKWFKTIKNK